VQLDQRAVRRNFGQAADSYDAAAALQATVRTELLDRAAVLLSGRAAPVRTILDLGAGTGAALPDLRARWPDAQLLALDAALPMAQRAAARLPQPGRIARLLGGATRAAAAVCADAARLPLADGSVDLVFSNLMLQWCDPPDAVLREIRRVLKPDGVVVLSTFGPDTLRELRVAWAQVDDGPHVSRFVDMHDLGDACVRAGLQEPVLDVDRLRTRHEDPMALLRHLKAIGARNAAVGRGSHLTGRGRLQAMCAAYPRDEASAVFASWEVIYASAFAGDAPSRTTGEFAIDAATLASSLGRRR
jgi:malonyl-CoA O-methyltransferase